MTNILKKLDYFGQSLHLLTFSTIYHNSSLIVDLET